MNDRFSFRVWDKVLKKFDDVTLSSEMTLNEWLDDISKSEDEVIQQCTGLKDKDGEMIYEGDIIKDFSGRWIPRIEYEVYWYINCWAIRTVNEKEEEFLYQLEAGERCTIIGNIFEGANNER